MSSRTQVISSGNLRLLALVFKIAIVFLGLEHSATFAFSPIQCLVDNISLPSNSVLSAWSPNHFSDPNHYNSKSFKFIIHAIYDSPVGAPPPSEKSKIGPIELFLQKDFFSKGNAYSASIVSNDVTRTFRSSGLILEAPALNIVATSEEDMHSYLIKHIDDGTIEQHLLDLKNKYGISTPETILKKNINLGWPSRHNEIIVRGTGSTGKKTSVIGYFIKTVKGVLQCSKHRLNLILEASKVNGLPIVLIDGEVSLQSNLSLEERDSLEFEKNRSQFNIHGPD